MINKKYLLKILIYIKRFTKNTSHLFILQVSIALAPLNLFSSIKKFVADVAVVTVVTVVAVVAVLFDFSVFLAVDVIVIITYCFEFKK